MLLFCIIASYCAINQWYVISPCCVIYNSWINRNISICYFFALLHHIVQYINDMWLHHIVWYAIPSWNAIYKYLQHVIINRRFFHSAHTKCYICSMKHLSKFLICSMKHISNSSFAAPSRCKDQEACVLVSRQP